MQLCVDLTPESIKQKASFRQAHEVLKQCRLEAGRYNLIPCTYTAGQECAFEVTAWSPKGLVTVQPIKTGLITLNGEWTAETAGGCINDMKSWLTNPRYYLAAKQTFECAIVLIQDAPATMTQAEPLKEIGFYVTSSDGDGNPKTNEASDLIAQSPFAPDRDSYVVCTIPACHWPYVITPCTFRYPSPLYNTVS